jgi:hypothetical protein
VPFSLFMVFAVGKFLFRTKMGLVIRAVGNSHTSAHALGYNVIGVRYLCVLFGGAMSGLAGGYLSTCLHTAMGGEHDGGPRLDCLGAGRFASWLPFRILAGAYLFGTISILSFVLQAQGLGNPLAIPLQSALSWHHPRTGGHIREQGPDAPQHAGLPRTALRAGQVSVHIFNRELHMKKYLMAAATAALMLGAASASASADALKACWVYVGPIGDFGWSYQHHQGLEAVKKEFGDKVETAYAENVTEADSEKTFERFAREGCKIIFGTSFGFMEPMLKVAKKFPDVKFEHATGYKTADNLGTYNAKFHEGRYVIGQIAAKMSKTGTAGYIVSFPIPEVVAGINAFMLGAQSVNPDFKVKIVWANTWFDPGQGSRCRQGAVEPGCRHHWCSTRIRRLRCRSPRNRANSVLARPLTRSSLHQRRS